MSRPKVHHCNSVATYMQAVEDFKRDFKKEQNKEQPSNLKADGKKEDRLFFFRGHADSMWKCKPAIAREPFTLDAIYDGTPRPSRDNAEWVLFSRFRAMSAALEPLCVASVPRVEADWRRVVLAQHHELPTRLLDWTTKSLVALYFAVQARGRGVAETDSVVVAASRLRPQVFSVYALAEMNRTPPCYSPENGEDVGFFWAPDIHQRVTLQGSVLSIGRKPTQEIDVEGRFKISKKYRRTIRDELYHLGIHEASLFPDLDGIARSLVAESKMWGPLQGVD
ncbi:MAG: FRG domain-containing protein [Planctomycetaceae bacterium]|nr:FRG domain-containing protein [Planctomycetaceae bacterium]